VPRRPEQNLRAWSRTAPCVCGAVPNSEVGFGLDDPRCAAVVSQYLSQQRPCDDFRRAIVKASR
jgi:hypothetical protein